MSLECQRKFIKKMLLKKTYRLLKNPLCAVPIFLFIFIISFYFTLQTALHNGYSEESRKNYEPILFHGEKIVHLDLKGAPLKMDYLRKVFPLIAELGATAVLIEYEEMFPFEGEIKLLRSPFAYNLNEIEMINMYAEEANLKIIPLIQTFSHLEYVLKRSKFKELREYEKYPTDICPSNPMTREILGEIIEQILYSHPKSTIVHIGGNVKYLRKCAKCQMKDNLKLLYIEHIKSIATIITSINSQITVLVGGEFLRTIDSETMISNNFSSYVQPVISSCNLRYINEKDLIEFQQIFGCIWFAGTFKGSISSDCYVTNPETHVAKTRSFLHTYHIFKSKLKVRGIFLFGPQRYDHFSSLCEFIPVSIPSLAISLFLLNGRVIPDLIPTREMNNILECRFRHATVYLGNGRALCAYPGADLLDDMLHFYKFKSSYKDFKTNVIGVWMNSYNIKYEVYSRKKLENILDKVSSLRKELTKLKDNIINDMEDIYQLHTIEEWLDSYTIPIDDDLTEIVRHAYILMNKTVWD